MSKKPNRGNFLLIPPGGKVVKVPCAGIFTDSQGKKHPVPQFMKNWDYIPNPFDSCYYTYRPPKVTQIDEF